MYYSFSKHMLLSIFEHSEPLKYRKIVLQNIFNNLKECGLYKEENDEEFVNYLDQEF